MGRRKSTTTLAALATTLALILTACGSDSTTEGDGDESETGTATSAADPGEGETTDDTGDPAAGPPGGVLDVALTEAFSDFDPSKLFFGTFATAESLYNTLITLTDDLEPQPELATSWEFNDDSTELTMMLQEGVTFHDGTPFDAQTVVDNVEWYRDPETGAHIGGLIGTIEAVEAVDDTTVRFTFTGPSPTIFDGLDLMYMVKPGTTEEVASSGVGTGPFQLEEYSPGDSVVMSRYDDYWGEPALLDQVVVRQFPDVQTALVNLESGQVDVVMQPPWPEIARLRESAEIQIGGSVPEVGFVILFNTNGGEPYDNALVRQAVSKAVDRDRMMELALGGEAVASCLPWSPESPAYDASIEDGCVRDVEAARALLEEAGYPDGVELDVIYSQQRYDESAALAELLQSDLAEAGITVNLTSLESAPHIEALNNGDYTASVQRYGRSNRNPLALFGAARSHRPTSGYTGFGSDEYVGLVEELAVTADPARLDEIYGELNQILVDEEFAVTLGKGAFAFAASSKVKNFDYTLGGLVQAGSAWLDE